MVPIPLGLRMDLSAKDTLPSTLSLKYSKQYFINARWQVAPVLRNQVFIQDENQVLNKTSFIPTLQ